MMVVITVAIFALFRMGGHALIGIPMLLAAGGVLFGWIGMYTANNFLATVEETACGNDAVTWPKGGGLLDGLGRFFYFIWIVGSAVIPTAAIWSAYGPGISDADYAWLPCLIPFLLIFPVLLLSALTADAWWMVLDVKIIGLFLMRPHAFFLVVVPPLALLSLCLVLSHRLASQPTALVIGGAAIAWSTFLLLYARLVGRAGWILTGSTMKTHRRVRPKRIIAQAPSPPDHDDDRVRERPRTKSSKSRHE
jgi:hypothetical protein